MKVAIFDKSDHSCVRAHSDAVDMVIENVDGETVVNVVVADDTAYPYYLRYFDICVGE